MEKTEKLSNELIKTIKKNEKGLTSAEVVGCLEAVKWATIAEVWDLAKDIQIEQSLTKLMEDLKEKWKKGFQQ